MIPRGYFDQLKSENEEEIKFALRALALMKTADIEREEAKELIPPLRNLFKSKNSQICMLARSVAGKIANLFPDLKNDFFENKPSEAAAAVVGAGVAAAGLGAAIIGGGRLLGAVSSAAGILGAIGAATVVGVGAIGAIGLAAAVLSSEKKDGKTGPELVEEDIPLPQLYEKLNSLVGLASVKSEITSLANVIKMNAEKQTAGQTKIPISLNLVFQGNPGTGKTEVARLFGKFCKCFNVLSRGHLLVSQRSDFTGQYMGETEKKVPELIEKAKGGVLFIDEAYSLCEDDNDLYGKQAVQCLLTGMEKYREDLFVIIAGYPDKIKKFLETNPGLKSRFTRFINFPDYSSEELMQIFELHLKQGQYALSSSARSKAEEIFSSMVKKKDANFGNARDVRKSFEKILFNQANRLANSPHSQEQLKNIEVADISGASDVFDSGKPITEVATDSNSLNETILELECLIGLQGIKKEVKTLVNTIAFQQKRIKAGFPEKSISLHCAFLGNPGTGKTEVARVYAKILKHLGILGKGDLVEVQRSDLIAKYQGHTTEKTMDVIKKALDGVLFIDEAYSLITSDHDDFGQEIISTLLTAMETYRERLVVIVAGYQNQMTAFFDTNPGLRSRFSRSIVFPNYSPKELAEIFMYFAGKEMYKISSDGKLLLERLSGKMLEAMGYEFGNARDIRNFFERAKQEFANRHSSAESGVLSFFKKEDLETIQSQDLTKAFNSILPNVGVENVSSQS